VLKGRGYNRNAVDSDKMIARFLGALLLSVLPLIFAPPIWSAVCVGAVCGYCTYNTLSARTAGGPNQFDLIVSQLLGRTFSTSLQFTVGHALHVHVHHWLYLTILSCVLSLDWTVPQRSAAVDCVRGFCAGGCLHGALFSDASRVVWCQRRNG
jgi:hypothetical protein